MKCPAELWVSSVVLLIALRIPVQESLFVKMVLVLNLLLLLVVTKVNNVVPRVMLVVRVAYAVMQLLILVSHVPVNSAVPVMLVIVR